MPKCVYCGKEYALHKGMTLVMNDGTVNHFCSSKCRKNMRMKRRKVKWISKKKAKTATEIKELYMSTTPDVKPLLTSAIVRCGEEDF